MITGFGGETEDPDSVLDCVFPTKAAPNSGCDSVYSDMKSEGDQPSFHLALRNRARVLCVEPGGETERGVRPLAVTPITGESCISGWNFWRVEVIQSAFPKE